LYAFLTKNYHSPIYISTDHYCDLSALIVEVSQDHNIPQMHPLTGLLKQIIELILLQDQRKGNIFHGGERVKMWKGKFWDPSILHILLKKN
jgi:hypothetical protein